MKILILSDSHSALRFMRSCIEAVKPDAVIHLGDHYDDAQVIAQENPHIVVHQVPGNCDQYRCPLNTPQVLCYCIGGVKLFMTHGHRFGVKSGYGGVVAAARAENARAVLFGHTHQAVCLQEPDGFWIVNPGSCGSCGGSAAVMETAEDKITACRLIRQADLEPV